MSVLSEPLPHGKKSHCVYVRGHRSTKDESNHKTITINALFFCGTQYTRRRNNTNENCMYFYNVIRSSSGKARFFLKKLDRMG